MPAQVRRGVNFLSLCHLILKFKTFSVFLIESTDEVAFIESNPDITEILREPVVRLSM